MFNLLAWCNVNIYVYKYFIFKNKFREKKLIQNLYKESPTFYHAACEMTAVLQGTIKMENCVKTTSPRKPCAPFPA